MKRPVYDRGLQEKCLEIRATGIGMNGVPVVFNRKSKKGGQPRAKPKPTVVPQPDHADLLDALKELGLATTAHAVKEAVTALYPNGLAGIDQGDVVRKVFLHLQTKKK
jgi:signal recognition particle subunit SEC65